MVHSFSNPQRRTPATRSTILLVDDDALESHARADVLESHFSSVYRVPDAAQAFIRLNDHEFAASVALVLVSLRLPGLSGPAFVRELAMRLGGVPILVIGKADETAPDYPTPTVRFLPRTTSASRLLSEAGAVFSSHLRMVA